MLLRVVRKTNLGGEHHRGDFRAQFFLGVVWCAKATAQVSIEAGLVTGPVAEFVQRRVVVAGGLGKLSAFRERDRVC